MPRTPSPGRRAGLCAETADTPDYGRTAGMAQPIQRNMTFPQPGARISTRPGGRTRLTGGVGDADDLGRRRVRPGALRPPPCLARFGQHVDRVVVGVLAGERQLVVGLDGGAVVLRPVRDAVVGVVPGYLVHPALADVRH